MIRLTISNAVEDSPIFEVGGEGTLRHHELTFSKCMRYIKNFRFEDLVRRYNVDAKTLFYMRSKKEYAELFATREPSNVTNASGTAIESNIIRTDGSIGEAIIHLPQYFHLILRKNLSLLMASVIYNNEKAFNTLLSIYEKYLNDWKATENSSGITNENEDINATAPNEFKYIQTDEEGWTALHYAAILGRVSFVIRLVKFEARCVDKYGETALVKAIKGGYLEMIQLLLPYEYKIASKNNFTPEMWAAARCQETVKQFYKDFLDNNNPLVYDDEAFELKYKKEFMHLGKKENIKNKKNSIGTPTEDSKNTKSQKQRKNENENEDKKDTINTDLFSSDTSSFVSYASQKFFAEKDSTDAMSQDLSYRGVQDEDLANQQAISGLKELLLPVTKNCQTITATTGNDILIIKKKIVEEQSSSIDQTSTLTGSNATPKHQAKENQRETHSEHGSNSKTEDSRVKKYPLEGANLREVIASNKRITAYDMVESTNSSASTSAMSDSKNDDSVEEKFSDGGDVLNTRTDDLNIYEYKSSSDDYSNSTDTKEDISVGAKSGSTMENGTATEPITDITNVTDQMNKILDKSFKQLDEEMQQKIKNQQKFLILEKATEANSADFSVFTIVCHYTIAKEGAKLALNTAKNGGPTTLMIFSAAPFFSIAQAIIQLSDEYKEFINKKCLEDQPDLEQIRKYKYFYDYTRLSMNYVLPKEEKTDPISPPPTEAQSGLASNESPNIKSNSTRTSEDGKKVESFNLDLSTDKQSSNSKQPSIEIEKANTESDSTSISSDNSSETDQIKREKTMVRELENIFNTFQKVQLEGVLGTNTIYKENETPYMKMHLILQMKYNLLALNKIIITQAGLLCNGNFALKIAILNGNKFIVIKLNSIEGGLVDNNGDDSLVIALKSGSCEIIDLLIDQCYETKQDQWWVQIPYSESEIKQIRGCTQSFIKTPLNFQNYEIEKGKGKEILMQALERQKKEGRPCKFVEKLREKMSSEDIYLADVAAGIGNTTAC